MAVEWAHAHAVPKSWGITDLRPWSKAHHHDEAVGEIWYERSGNAVKDPCLLLKLLFTKEPLSIQVHPNDAFAQSMGLPNGKTEAWYVLSAAPGAQVALGLHRRLTPQEFRQAIDDGTISDLVEWRNVTVGDVILVPAGTVHAIGAGLIIAEIQQRSDTTFRLFDYGRQRDLHVENAIAVADTGPAESRVQPDRITNERTLLATCPYFVFERIDLAPNSAWCLDAERETWLLVLSGNIHAGSFDIAKGDVIFAQSDRINLRAGAAGVTGLVACAGGRPVLDLLRHLGKASAVDIGRQAKMDSKKRDLRVSMRAQSTARKHEK